MGLFAYNRIETERRAKLAESLSVMSPQVESLPSADVLKDFEVIRRLGQSPAPDHDLLALMASQ